MWEAISEPHGNSRKIAAWLFVVLYKSLRRLEIASYAGQLESAAQLEEILLRDTPAIQSSVEEVFFAKHRVDVVSQAILKKNSVGKLQYF